MDILLDTQVLLWALGARSRLPLPMRDAIEARTNIVFVSSASVWEMAVKVSLGKLDLGGLDLGELPRFIEASGFDELPVVVRHALAVQGLPPRHRDPFDRMLIAQARAERLKLATVDPLIRQYDVEIL
jgi:PIN domain nuclease of toxin-antitoxin system